MRIVVEMIFKTEDAGRVMNFANVFVRKNEDVAATVYKVVKDKMREYIIDVEIEAVKAAGEDITEKILVMEKALPNKEGKN